MWERPLPRTEGVFSSLDAKAPVLARNGRVWYATWDRYEFPGSERVDPAKRGQLITLLDVDVRTGDCRTHSLHIPSTTIPRYWTFAQSLFLCGSAVALDTEPRLLDSVPFAHPFGYGPPESLVMGSNLIIGDSETESIRAIDLVGHSVAWSRSFPSDLYGAGQPRAIGDRITCHGPKGLQFLDPSDGSPGGSIRIPRVDLLFDPIRVGSDLVMGWANWTVGGLLRYDPEFERVLWRHKRRSDDHWRRVIWRVGDVGIWAKGETELIGVDLETGSEAWVYPMWRYLISRVEVIENHLLFGTSGRDGGIHLVDGHTGEHRWKRLIEDGCPFYGLRDNSVIVPSAGGHLYELDLATGAEMDSLDLGSPLIGYVAVAGRLAITTAMPRPGAPARLVAVELES